MSSYNTLYIDIEQSPSLLSSIESIKLSSNIYYLNADRQQLLLNTADGTASYAWLYSADGGQTFKTLNQNSPSLSLDVNTLNIQYIYKLKVSVDRNSSSLLSNSSDTKNIVSNTSDNIILTNQADDDSEVWYSEAITINHNLDLEDIIVDMALNDIIEQLGDEINFNNQLDNLELNTEYEESIENTQNIESVTIGADSPTGGAGYLTTTCYERRVNYFCGVKIDYCVKKEEFIFPGSDFVCNGIEVCAGKCIVEEEALFKLDVEVGDWFNTKIGNGHYKWCVGGVQTLAPSDSVSRLSDYGSCGDPIADPERGKALLCADAGSATSYRDCPDVKNHKGGCPGEEHNIAPRKWCNPEICPGTSSTRFKTLLTLTSSTKQHKCHGNKYVYQGGCSCTDKSGNTSVEYGGGCAGPDCTSVAAPSLSYNGVIPVNVVATPDGKLHARFIGRPKLKSNTTYELTLQDNSEGNHNANDSLFFTTGYMEPDSDICDIHSLNLGSDDWGPCINGGTCYDGDDIDPSVKCFEGNAYYQIIGGGTETYSCVEHCGTDSPPIADAPVIIVAPVASRPSSSEGLYTLDAAIEKIADDNDPDPYYLRIDSLQKDWRKNTKCEYYCEVDYKTKEYRVATTASIGIGGPSLFNACTACNCETSAECGGCEVCCDGTCVGYPSDKENAACHPCAAIPGGVCCTSFDALGNKTVTCANPKYCEECIGVASPSTGTTAGVPYNPNDPTIACCEGVKYDPRCKQCEEGTITDICIPPKVCTKSGTSTWDDYSNDPLFPTQITYDTFSCIIPPCPHCTSEADDYETSGSCVPYNGSVDAILACMQCEVVDNPLYPSLSDEPQMPLFTSTLDEGQTCCQTGAETASPADVCCPGDTYSIICSTDESCCNGDCLDPGQCCGDSGAEDEPICQDCEGKEKCPSGTTCCTGTDPNPPYGVIFVGCADPNQCQECGSGWGNSRQGVRPTYDTTDPCLVCNEGSVDTVTSDDPEDPCYSAPQSIFYEP